MVVRICTTIGLCALILASSARATVPAKECQAIAYLIQQARIDFDSIRDQQFPKGRCSSRGNDFTCAWGFPGDAYGFAEEEVNRLKRCVGAYPTAHLVPGKKGAAQFAVEPDVIVIIARPEIDRDGQWSVSFRIQQAAND